MRTKTLIQGLGLAALLVLPFGVQAQEGITFEVLGRVGMDGNEKEGYGCDGKGTTGQVIVPFTYNFSCNETTVSGTLRGCCGNPGLDFTPVVSIEVSGATTLFSVLNLTVKGEICSANFTANGIPSCFDAVTERSPALLAPGGGVSTVTWLTSIMRNSNSVPVAVWSVKDRTGALIQDSPAEGHYELVADGMSAAIATVINTEQVPTFQFTGDALGCTLGEEAGHPVLTSGTNYGTVQVTAVLNNDTNPCLQRDFFFDLLPPCDTCASGNCRPGTVTASQGSVDVLINLGPGRDGLGPAYLQVKSEEPTMDLGTPALLRCNFIQPDLEKITDDAGWVRQLRVMDGFVEVLTNSASSYSIAFHDPTNLVGLNNGLYLFTNSPERSVTIELVGGDTNHLRITESEGSVVTDYHWETAGWALETGGGLRRETKLVTVAGDKRRETTTIKPTGGSVEREFVKVWQTNAFGERLIEEVFGSGAAARTNSYRYHANGLLEQVVRGNGSWDIYQYDALGRQIEHYSPFLNSAPTTNPALCRRISSTYDNSTVSGSGDDGDIGQFIPRRVIESVQGTEISRRYTVVKENERREILCPNPGAAWNDTGNLVTTSHLRTDSAHYGKPAVRLNADGTVQRFTYTTAALPGTTTPKYQKTIVESGAPNGGVTAILRGTRTETWADKAGRTLYEQTTDIESGLLTEREIFTYDADGRITFINYIDGTMQSRTYDCCHLLTATDRAGTVTHYTSDALGRQLTMTRDGITTSNVWNAAGDRLAQYRIGTNGNTIRLNASGYDTAGRLLSTTNALENVTFHEESLDPSGQTTRTTTRPDGSTEVHITARDGTLLERNGTGVFPARYTNGVVTVGGKDRFYSQEIRLLTNGNDSAEWARTIQDGIGRTLRTELPGATNTMTYNATGQMASSMDADGVTTLYAYDKLGELEYAAVDADQDGQIDLDGPDRVAHTVTAVTNSAAHGAAVRLTRRYVYASDNDATATLLAERADSLYTRQTWLSADGLTNSSGLDYLGSGATRVTRTTPEGTQVIELFQSGRPLNVTVSNTITGLLRKETYGYDQHNRRDTVTDLRTGTLRFTFDDLDRVVTVTTPAPGAGQSAQVTTLVHDDADRVERSQAADGLWTTNELYPNGALRKISGARVYPVEFTYDYAGRPATLKTWQDHAGDSGTAITSWKHDDRGLVTNKLDHTGQGPCYTYTPAGRLATRTWARTVGGQPLITSYHYNDAGDLERIDYSDTTPDVGYAYDRLGRPTHVEGSTTNDYGFTAHGQLLSEDAANSSWSYISQARLGYDALRRRSALTNLTLGLIQFYGYDAASRLDIVSTVHGGLTTMAGYSYLSNSPLVETVTFQRGGTTRLTTARDYDNLNRLTSITSANDTWPDPVSFAYAYNAANQRTGVTNADASHWNYGYDSLGQVTNGWRFWADGSHVLGQTFNYSFDDIGNRRTTETGGDAAGSSLRRATYSANRLNQYTQRTVPGFLEANGTASSPAEVSVNGSLASRQGDYFRQEATVDNSGAALQQWLSILAVNAGKTTTVSRLALVPKTPEAFTHDADGNLTGDGLWDYTWDAENRLTQIELQTNAITDSDCWQRIDCDYDHLNRRIRKRIATWNTHSAGYRLKRSLRYFYNGWNLVGQTDEVTGQRLTFLWGADLSGTLQGAGGVGGLLAMTVHNGPEAGSYFYGFDGNGNVAVLVNAADGSEAARYEYGPFGELIRATGPLASINPFRFSTKYQDDETRLIYYGHRYYSAGTGRWLSEDPIAEQGGMNLYGFVGNHATSGFDPDGLNLYAIDGTGNDRAAESNVSRFFDRYLDGEKHYFGGPGNPSDGIPILGLSHGAGSAGIVDAVIKRICDDLKSNPNITIDLVGFSRGGAIANQVATELDKKGCPCYRGRGRGRKFLSQTKPRIRFLGLFDPVYSFPLIATPFWNDDTIPPNVDNAAIALASDENRKNFRPSILTPSDPDLTSIDLEWFPGVHSDVGGHKDFNSLISNWTLRYMIDQGRSAGLAMDAESDINYLATQQTYEEWHKTHPKWFKPTSMWSAAPLTPTTWLHD